MPHIDEPPGDSCSVRDLVTVDVQTPEDADALFASLADHRRRLLVERVAEHTDPTVIEEVVRHVAEREDGATPKTHSSDTLVETKSILLHQHLPEMAEAGILDVDHETNMGQEGDRFDVATALLEVV